MHYNMLFQDRNLKNFLVRGTAPPQNPPHWGGRNHSPYSTPPPRRSTSRAFGARFYVSRIFSVDCWQR